MDLSGRRWLLSLLIGASLVMAFTVPGHDASDQHISYRTGTWDTEKFGNHRAVVTVAAQADAVWVHIPWRRRDGNPEAKNIIIVD